MALARSRLTVSDLPTADALIAGLPSAVIVLDADRRVAMVNAAAEVMLNTSAGALGGQPLEAIVQMPTACLDRLRDDAVFAAYGCTVETGRGARLLVDVHAAPIAEFPDWRMLTLTSAAMMAAMGQYADGRERGRAAIGAAAMLAHEIKNPLAGIRGAAQLLDARADAETRTLTRLIRDEVDRVTALIDHMEAFTDSRPLVRAPENIFAILEHVRAVSRAAFGDRLEIRDEYDPSLPEVLVSRDAMIQILLNLIANAAEAVTGARPGIVYLTARYRQGFSMADARGRHSLPIEICVVDDGPGPNDDIVEHLFEPFVSSKSAGRGLGLALVDKLVRANGGVVQFAREGVPPRSVFRIMLPRAA